MRPDIERRKISYWSYEKHTVNAWNKSDARASLKKRLGLKRLPVGAAVKQIS